MVAYATKGTPARSEARQQPKRGNLMIQFERIKAALDSQPHLTDFGFDCFGRLGKDWTQADVERDHAALYKIVLEERWSGILEQAVNWLSAWPRNKYVNRNMGTTYGLKHQFTNELDARGYEPHPYITNGLFILAAILAGLTIERCTPTHPNAWLNLSSRRKAPAPRYADERGCSRLQ
jgi:hypothetical protein